MDFFCICVIGLCFLSLYCYSIRCCCCVSAPFFFSFFSVLYMIRRLGNQHYGLFTALINLTAIASVVLDLGFNVLFVREGARHRNEIQRYLRSVMSLRLFMSVAALLLLAVLVYPLGLGDL